MMRVAFAALAMVALAALSCDDSPATVTPAPTERSTATLSPTPTSIPAATSTTVPDDAAASTDPQPTPEPTRAVPADMVKTLAPVESVLIRVAESYPPQYFADVVSGLPDACAEFYGYEKTRTGNRIDIAVYNLAPAPYRQVACAQVFTPHEFVVPLGSDFLPGATYVLEANGVSETFVAQ